MSESSSRLRRSVFIDETPRKDMSFAFRWMLLISSILIGWSSFPVVSAQNVNTNNDCFQTCPNTKVNCLYPFERRTGVTEQQCKDLCTQYASDCKSAQYNCLNKVCDLFCTSPNMYYGRRKRGTGELEFFVDSAPVSYAFADLALPEGDGRVHETRLRKRQATGTSITATQGGSKCVANIQIPVQGLYFRGKRGAVSYASYSYKPQYQAMYVAPANYAGSSCGYGSLVRCPGYMFYRPTGTCQSTPSPAQDDCGTGKVSRYFVYDGYKMSGNGDTSFNADTEAQCLQACTTSQKPDGTAAKCQSSSYNPSTKQCTISSQTTASDQLVQEAGTKYYQKICVDAAIGQRCPGPYIRDPQHILIGFAQSVVTATDANDCFQQCANSQTRFNFVCVSGMFYFGESQDNCILNTETRTTQPDKYQAEAQDKVDYFELNCNARAAREVAWPRLRNRNVIRLQSTKYASWTMCDKKNLQHNRYKECTSGNPNKCQKHSNECDPDKENTYDQDDDDVSTTVSTTTAMSTTSSPTTATTSRSTTTKRSTSASGMHRSHSNSGSGTTARSAVFHHTTASDQVTARPLDKICQPLLQPDGSLDCQNGLRITNAGKTRKCRPTKKQCQ